MNGGKWVGGGCMKNCWFSCFGLCFQFFSLRVELLSNSTPFKDGQPSPARVGRRNGNARKRIGWDEVRDELHDVFVVQPPLCAEQGVLTRITECRKYEDCSFCSGLCVAYWQYFKFLHTVFPPEKTSFLHPRWVVLASSGRRFSDCQRN